MSNGEGDYKIIGRTHIDRWNPDLQATESGWKLTVLWQATKTIIPVFVADADYNATNVDSAIRQAGYLDNSIGQLGGASG